MEARGKGIDWVVAPAGNEIERTEPVWWGITIGGAAFAVKALNADEAVAKAQETSGCYSFPFMFAELHGEEYQPQFDERYPKGGTKRIIPFSMVEWPEDPTNMTDEQKLAFERLKPKG